MKTMLALILMAAMTSTAMAQQSVSIETLPASVIKTEPRSGDDQVEAATTKQISVTFSKEMLDGCWSWVQVSEDTFPKILGSPRYLADRRTCVVDVELQPNKTYVVWLNNHKFTNFKDTRKQPSVPYLLVFSTR